MGRLYPDTTPSVTTPSGGGRLYPTPTVDHLNGFSTIDQQPSVGGFLGNVVKSSANVFKGIGNAVFHPYDTLSGIANLGAGALEKGAGAIAGKSISSPETQQFDNVINFFKQRYGSVDALKNTIYQDPAGFALDLSTVLGGAGALASKAGEAADIGTLSKVGSTLEKAGEATNPVPLIAKGVSNTVKGAAKLTGKVGGEALGITTGAGFGAIKEAYQNGGEAFTKAMRGETTNDAVVNTAKEALGAAKQARSDEYVKQLETISKDKTSLDVSPVVKEVDAQLGKFNISKNGDGTLDFSRSAIRFDKEAQNTVNTIVNEMKGFGTKAGDRTAIGIDSLKRSLNDLYSPSSQIRAFTKAIEGKTRGVLSQVKGYDELAGNYTEKSKFITETQKALSLGDKASVDTTLRKLTSSLRQNNEFRRSLVSELENYGGKDITGQLAGNALSGSVPRGGTGKLLEGATVAGGLFLHDPTFVLGLAAATPRVVGEFVRGLGITAKQITKFSNFLKESGATNAAENLTKSLYYAGKLTDVSQSPKQSVQSQ